MNDYSPKILKAKSCFGHLGGALGNRLFERLLELNWFEREEDTSTVYRLTEKGQEEFARLGVDFLKRGR
jgi:predicted transcriptional regulator